MAFEFPSNPTNGQQFGNYYWDASTGAWRNLGSKDALAQRLTALEASPAGLVRIAPTSVSVGSGTASVSSTGVVTCTGSTSVSLNSIFNGTYRNYRIFYNSFVTTNSTSPDLAFRFRVGTTDRVSNDYYQSGIVISSGNPSTSSLYSGFSPITYTLLAPIDATDGNRSSGVIDVFSPNESGRTTATFQATGTPGASMQSRLGHILWNQPESINGFTLYSANGAPMNGTIQVYGYRN